MHASTLSFRAAVIFGIAGMIMGIVMAASGNHSVIPAHAHLNLLGWVGLFVIGILLTVTIRPSARAGLRWCRSGFGLSPPLF